MDIKQYSEKELIDELENLKSQLINKDNEIKQLKEKLRSYELLYGIPWK